MGLTTFHEIYPGYFPHYVLLVGPRNTRISTEYAQNYPYMLLGTILNTLFSVNTYYLEKHDTI